MEAVFEEFENEVETECDKRDKQVIFVEDFDEEAALNGDIPVSLEILRGLKRVFVGDDVLEQLSALEEAILGASEEEDGVRMLGEVELDSQNDEEDEEDSSEEEQELVYDDGQPAINFQEGNAVSRSNSIDQHNVGSRNANDEEEEEDREIELGLNPMGSFEMRILMAQCLAAIEETMEARELQSAFGTLFSLTYMFNKYNQWLDEADLSELDKQELKELTEGADLSVLEKLKPEILAEHVEELWDVLLQEADEVLGIDNEDREGIDVLREQFRATVQEAQAEDEAPEAISL